MTEIQTNTVRMFLAIVDGNERVPENAYVSQVNKITQKYIYIKFPYLWVILTDIYTTQHGQYKGSSFPSSTLTLSDHIYRSAQKTI